MVVVRLAGPRTAAALLRGVVKRSGGGRHTDRMRRVANGRRHSPRVDSPGSGLDVDRGDDRLELRSIRGRRSSRDPGVEGEAATLDVEDIHPVHLIISLDVSTVA